LAERQLATDGARTGKKLLVAGCELLANHLSSPATRA
jgi:hypothetical protein